MKAILLAAFHMTVRRHQARNRVKPIEMRMNQPTIEALGREVDRVDLLPGGFTIHDVLNPTTPVRVYGAIIVVDTSCRNGEMISWPTNEEWAATQMMATRFGART